MYATIILFKERMRVYYIMEEEIKYPYIVFKIADSLYCINSRYISTIVQLPHYDKIPAAPPNVKGMFRHRDKVIQMLDLRATFGFKTMTEECQEFESMIDARKQDHINWVNELERSIETGEPFKLAKDPHQCALGRWYDQFHTDNNAVRFHLRKIEEPHQRLHHAADDAAQCEEDCALNAVTDCQNQVLHCAKEECMPAILNLLDETKKIFSSSIYKEMVLLLDGMKWGVVVDEIMGVQDLEVIDQRDRRRVVNQSSYILNVLEDQTHSSLIFELNVSTLFHQLEEYEKVL